jgi:hypothetical protein
MGYAILHWKINIFIQLVDRQHQILLGKNLINYLNLGILLPVIFGKEIKLEIYSKNVKD